MTDITLHTLEDMERELEQRHEASESIIKFAQYMNPAFEIYKPHEMIAEHLHAVWSGECRRLAVFIPPGSGKSELISRTFAAWGFGHDPLFKFIQTSYVSDLAEGFSRHIRNKIAHPRYSNVFPDVQLSADQRSVDDWTTAQGGTFRAEGVGGSLIGYHAQIAIVDDPFKGYEEAMNPNERRKAWDWYTGTLLNRLRPYKDAGGAVILVMQRWHDKDLGGLAEVDPDWTILKLPSLAEKNDPLGRSIGEPLIPQWRSKAELLDLQAKQPRIFIAAHQQKPIPDEGDIFSMADFGRYDADDLPPNLVFYAASDYAVTEDGGDFTVHLVAGISPKGHIYIVDMYRKQANSAQWVDAMIDIIQKYQPFRWAEERGQIIKGVGPFLSLRMQEEGAYTLRTSYTSSANKILRTSAIAGMVNEGRVLLPRSADWLGEFEHEIVRFPAAEHDDQVDAFSLLGRMIGKIKGEFKDQEPHDPNATDIAPRARTFGETMTRAAISRKGRSRLGRSVPGAPPTPIYEELNVA
tara:strand:- start:651 stop:2213 length:1563 start_codon:yes stop_codon:yes gene_type:complete